MTVNIYIIWERANNKHTGFNQYAQYMLKYKCCDCKRSFVVNSPGGKRDLYKKDTDKKKKNTGTERTRDTSNKDGFPWVQRLRSIHHKITVIQVPGADLDLWRTKQTGFNSWNKLR